MAQRFWSFKDRLPEDDDNAFTSDEMEIIVNNIKDSCFPGDESGRSIEEHLNAFFPIGSPEWLGFQTMDGACVVNCLGLLPSEKKGVVRIELQFAISDDLDGFEFSAMTVDGKPQPDSVKNKFEEAFIKA